MRLLVVAFGLLAGAGLAEVGLRLAGIRFDASLYTADPVRGWALRPGSEGWSVSEGDAYVRINSDGLADRERATAKPPHTLRIAVLGDSMTEARQVALEHRFTSVMQRELATCVALGGRAIDVINFGVPGYGTAQELLTVRSHVWKYEPDIVVVVFYAGNDLFDNHQALDTAPYPRPYFVYRDDRLTPTGGGERSPWLHPWYLYARRLVADAMNHSRLLQLVNHSRHAFRQPPPTPPNPEDTASAPLAEGGAGDGRLPADWMRTFPYVPPSHPALREAWRITEGLLLELKKDVTARGAEFWIVAATMPMQVHPDLAARAQLARRLAVDALDYADRRLETFAAEIGVPFLALSRPLGAYAAAHNVFLHGFPNTPTGFGHYNSLGHRIAGQTVASWLCGSLRAR
jgi:hypothetical protein